MVDALVGLLVVELVYSMVGKRVCEMVEKMVV